jgi:hypothetical protein
MPGWQLADRNSSGSERKGCFMGGRRTVLIGCALVMLVGLFSFPRLLLGSDQTRVKEMIQNNCAGCHRLEGKADSRFNLKAPDLIWAGSKYQRSWLLRYLTGKEAPLYPKGYRWDLSEGPTRHPVVTEDEAQGIAEYFEQHNKDARVKSAPSMSRKSVSSTPRSAGWLTRPTPVSDAT